MNINSISSVSVSNRNFGKVSVKPEYNFKELYNDFKVTKDQYIPGKEIVECMGPVFGYPISERDYMSFRSFFIDSLKFILGKGHETQAEKQKAFSIEAVENMINNAKEIGANAIISFKEVEPKMLRYCPMQGIAVKVKDGNEQKDIEQMNKYQAN